MRNKSALILLIFLFTLILGGCTSHKKMTAPSQTKTETPASQTSPLYQNNQAGLTINQIGDWKKDSEKRSTKGVNILFKTKTVQAIVSILSSKDSTSSIKKDLLNSVTSPKILSQTNNQLDFETGQPDQIHVTNFIQQKGSYSYIFSFISPEKDYSTNKPLIQSFMNKVKIN